MLQCNYLLLTPTAAWEAGIFLHLLKRFMARSANFPLTDERRSTRRVKEGTLRMDLAIPWSQPLGATVVFCPNQRAGFFFFFPGVFFSG